MKTIGKQKEQVGQQKGQLVQSKHIIKEALLSNPSLLTNIIVNLQQKSNEPEPQPQKALQNMEIFQESESQGKAEENANQVENQENKGQEVRPEEENFQFEQEDTPKSTHEKNKASKKTLNSGKIDRQRIPNNKEGRQTRRTTRSKPFLDSNTYEVEQKSEQQIQETRMLRKSSKKPNRSKNSTMQDQKQASNEHQQQVFQEKQAQKPKKQKIKEKQMVQRQFVIQIEEESQLKQMIAEKIGRDQGPKQKKKYRYKAVEQCVKILLLASREFQKFKLMHTEIKRQHQNQNQNPKSSQSEHSQRVDMIDYEREQKQDRVVSKETNRINLGSLSLLEIVQILKEEGLLSQSLYNKFATHHTNFDINDFLKKFSQGRLSQFDYKLIPFTLLDHRRFAQLLSNLRYQSYYIGEIISLNKQIHSFLVSLYDLQAEKYYKLYKNIDEISKIEWWSELIEAHKQEIIQACKRNLQHKKTNENDQQSKNTKDPSNLKKKNYNRRTSN